MTEVVQIDPTIRLFGGCFAIVREKKEWGLIVDVIGPTSNRGGPTIFPMRVSNGGFHYVGETHWEIPP